jgi:hypothetical protein
MSAARSKRTSRDDRGNPVGTTCEDALLSAEMALWRLLTGQGCPQADLHTAALHDAHWALPLLMRAGQLVMQGGDVNHAAAQQTLQQAQTALSDAPPREQAHAQALALLLEGRAGAACRLWDQLLVEHPGDVLALYWAQCTDHDRGDPSQLALRPARVLPEWDEEDPLYPQVLGLWAFGLQAQQALAQGEDTARRALAMDARVPAAIHAVAHVMHLQGRFDDGAAWLRHHQPQWSQAEGEASGHAAAQAHAAHLWAHTALCRLEGLDLKGALRVVDAHLTAPQLRTAHDMADAATVLWRLHLLGADVAARAGALARAWRAQPGARIGADAFADLHLLLLWLAAGDVAAAEHLVAKAAAQLMASIDARRDNHAVMREVGLPLARGFLAFARGERDVAAQSLFNLRHLAPRCGGTQVEREVIDLTLLAACVNAPRDGVAHHISRAVGHEHTLMRGQAQLTPLARYWAEALQDATQQVRP